MPSVVRVDAAWDGLPNGTVVSPGFIIGTNAFSTIQAGIDAVAAGGTVYVAAGIYAEKVFLLAPAKNGVAILGDQGAVVDGTTFGANERAFSITATDATVAGFTVRNVPVSYGIIILDTADVTIRDNTIENNGLGPGGFRGGLYARSVLRLTIANNQVLNNHNDGLTLSGGVHDAVIRGNLIEGNRFTGLFVGDGNVAAPTATALVEGNTIRVNGQGTATPLDPVDQFNLPGDAGVIVWDAGVNLRDNVVEANDPDGVVWIHFDAVRWNQGTPPDPAFNVISENQILSHPRLGILLFTLVTTYLAPIGPVVPPAAPVISKNKIEQNTEYGLVAVGGSNPVVSCNNIAANGAGLVNTWAGMVIRGQTFPAVTVVASNNWWGAASGPFHSVENPGGGGNRVSDFVAFVPWLELPSGSTAVDVWARVQVELVVQAVAAVDLKVPAQVGGCGIIHPVTIATTHVYDVCRRTITRTLQGSAVFSDVDFGTPFEVRCAVEDLRCRPALGVSTGCRGRVAVPVTVTYVLVVTVLQGGKEAVDRLGDSFIVTSKLCVPPGTVVQCDQHTKAACCSVALVPHPGPC